MGDTNYISDVSSYVNIIDDIGASSTLLFRGQDCMEPLIPKVARPNPKIDTSPQERMMLAELRRRTAREPALLGNDDWDALVIAQHFGMSTRLLDWTSNPLIALWFASADLDEAKEGFVYLLHTTDDLLLDRRSEPDPFSIAKTRIFKPSINNERIAAQAGWFTAHRYSSKDGRFVDLDRNKEMKRTVLMKGVRGKDKKKLVRSLDRLGVNHESVVPGLDGTCRYVDWLFTGRAT